MKIIRKTFGITAVLYLFLAMIPMSCGLFCRDSCGCGPKFSQQIFRIRSFELITAAFDGQRIFPDDMQPWDQYYKGLEVKDFDFITSSEGLKATFGVALACDPAPAKSDKKLLDIRIINLKEANLGDGTVLQVGDDISELFGINRFFAEGLQPIDSYLSEGYLLFLDEMLKIGFLQDPGKDLSLSIEISLILENGTTFRFDNEPFTIKSKR